MSSGSKPICYLSADDLKPGHLGDIFRSGYKAAVILDDPRVAKLRSALIPSPNDPRQKWSREILPWEANLSDIATNHLSQGSDWGMGDTLAYVPNHISYTARRICLHKQSITNEILSVPEEFYNCGQAHRLPNELVQTAWQLMSDVMKSVYPDGHCPSDYSVSIDRLKYDDSFQDLQNKIALIRDAGGKWSRLGHDMDAYLSNMARPFNVRYIRHLFAISSLLPGVGTVIRKLNRMANKIDDSKTIPTDMHLIGESHTDGRFFTCLCGNRLNIRTEYHDDVNWKELPVTSDALTIMPQRFLKDSCNINPTTHRILLTQRKFVATPFEEQFNGDRINASLVLGTFK